jgi:hypothetical protein
MIIQSEATAMTNPLLTETRAHEADLSMSELRALVHQIAADPSRWEPALRIPDGAERWWTRLSTDDHVDVWLLSWLPGHSTELHGHGDSAAAFAVVRGRLVELRLDGQGRPQVYAREPGSAIGIDVGVIHDVHGAGGGPAVSIHAYSPPLRRMTYYEIDRQGGVRAVRSVQTEEPEAQSL